MISATILTAPTLTNEALTPFQLQLRLATLLMVIDSRRPADLEHIVASLCSTAPTVVTLHFSRLKKQEQGAHIIRYHIENDLPSHRNLAAVLACHLANRLTALSEGPGADVPNLFLCKATDGSGC